jgi:hypothetical protein
VGGSYEQERLLRSLAATEAVRRLSVCQHDAFGRGDQAGWLGTFVVEGVLELPGAEPLQGHAALGKWFAGAVGGGRVPEILSTDSVVDIDGVRGTQHSRLLLLDGTAAAPVVTAVLAMDDELVFERGRWYFARRRVAPARADGA